MPLLAHTGFSRLCQLELCQPRGAHCHPSRSFIWNKVPKYPPASQQVLSAGGCWMPGGQEPVGSAQAGILGLYHHLEHWVGFLWCLKSAIGLKWLNLPTQSHFGTFVFAMSTVSSTWLQGTSDVFSGAAVGSCWIFYKAFLGLGVFSCTQNPTVVTEHRNEISYLIHFPSYHEFLLFFLWSYAFLLSPLLLCC